MAHKKPSRILTLYRLDNRFHFAMNPFIVGKAFRDKCVTFLKSINKSPISDAPAAFDTEKFYAKVHTLDDPWLLNHVDNVLSQGYTVIEDSVPEGLIIDANNAYEDWKLRNKTSFLETFYKHGEHLDRVVNLQSILPEFKALFSFNRSLVIQDFIFQKQTSCYTSLFFETGTEQEIHQDISYFWTSPAYQYFGMWLALEDADYDNGPLIVIPRSHHLSVSHRCTIAASKYSPHEDIPTSDSDLNFAYHEHILQQCKDLNLQKKTILVKKGSTILWHPLLAHGGSHMANKSRTRKSFVVHTTPVGTPVYQHNVFFRPRKAVSRMAPWSYAQYGGRKIANTGGISIGHKNHNFDFSILR